jgi:hypothetical protein
LFLPYRQFHHYHHGLRMWYDYLRCLHSFLKIDVDLCFKFDLIREVLDIRDCLKEIRGSLKLRFDCSTIKLHKSISKIQINVMSKAGCFNFTLIKFSVNNIWDILIWAHLWPYEPIDHLIWAHPRALRAYRRSECVYSNTFYNVVLKIAPENPFKEQIYYISGSNYGTWIIKLRFMRTIS